MIKKYSWSYYQSKKEDESLNLTAFIIVLIAVFLVAIYAIGTSNYIFNLIK